jgi:hypothetical protein
MTAHGIYWAATLLLAALSYWFGRRSHVLLFALFALPGTLTHELLHFLVGLALGAKPASLSVIPKRERDGAYQLGSVAFRRINLLNAAPAALAPLLALPLAWHLVEWRVGQVAFRGVQPLEAAWCYLAACMIVCSLPSRADLRIALKAWPLAVALAVAGGWWLVR